MVHFLRGPAERTFAMRYAAAAFLLLLVSWSSLAASQELSQPVVLVATPELRDPIYGRTVLVVKPFGVGKSGIGRSGSEKIRRKDDWKGRSNRPQTTVKSMKICV